MNSSFAAERWIEAKPVARSIQYGLRRPDEAKNLPNPRPLVLYLHGAGGKGDDFNKVLGSGLPKWLEESRTPFPYWLLVPQCPAQQSGWPIETVAALLQDIIRTQPVDASRVYLTGASMGGRGVYELAYDFGHWFAAAAPLCAFGIPTLAPRLKDLPLWAFHGDQDSLVPLRYGQDMADALQAAGCPNRFTILHGHGHHIERVVYAMPELWTWFSGFTRRRY